MVPWDLFGSWIREVVGARREIVVAMDWTDFDADNQSTLALHLVTPNLNSKRGIVPVTY